MECPSPDHNQHKFKEAKHATHYVERYLQEHTYPGRTSHERLVLDFTVQSTRKKKGSWLVPSSKKRQPPQALVCKVWIVALGLTSAPHVASFSDSEKYTGRVVHQEAFGGSRVFASPDVKRVVVSGGAKSTADMVYASIQGR